MRISDWSSDVCSSDLQNSCRFRQIVEPGAPSMRLTSADEALLSLLRENARAPTAEIARRLQLSRTTVQSRIERLERLGVIAGYTVRAGDDFEHEQVSALIDRKRPRRHSSQ